jgi:hypothetical protein
MAWRINRVAGRRRGGGSAADQHGCFELLYSIARRSASVVAGAL